MFSYKKKFTSEMLFIFRSIEKSLIDINISPNLIEKILKALMKFSASSKIEPNFEDLKTFLKIFLLKILDQKVCQIDINQLDTPATIFICGINGSGKTSAITKMSYLLNSLGWSVMITSFDDFRPAALNQLEEYANLTNAIFLKKEETSDYKMSIDKSILKIEEAKPDIVLFDTSGRMSVNQNLMIELQTIKKTIEKKMNKPITHKIFIFDATLGYNILSQLAAFKELIGVTGIIITKVDLVNSSGLILSAIDQIDVKIHGITNGNEINKLSDFNPVNFIDSLISQIDVKFE